MDGGEWFARIRKSDGRRRERERAAKGDVKASASARSREGRGLKGFHFGLMFILLVVRPPLVRPTGRCRHSWVS